MPLFDPICESLHCHDEGWFVSYLTFSEFFQRLLSGKPKVVYHSELTALCYSNVSVAMCPVMLKIQAICFNVLLPQTLDLACLERPTQLNAVLFQTHMLSCMIRRHLCRYYTQPLMHFERILQHFLARADPSFERFSVYVESNANTFLWPTIIQYLIQRWFSRIVCMTI